MSDWMRWAPAAVLLSGVLLVGAVADQSELPLRSPLERAVPGELVGYHGAAMAITEEERRVTGATADLARIYRPTSPGLPDFLTVYVGYYASQRKGKTIHSPKNCLPGAGWEPLGSTRQAISTASGTVLVNRYLLQKGDTRAVALYWYQGRGRIESNEYAVKWDLLRDAALRGRSDEALVRVMVPIVGSEAEAARVAVRAAGELIPAVSAALPI